MSKKQSCFAWVSELLYTIFCVATAMVGYTIHSSVFWAVVDLFLAPLVWCKWLIFHEVNMSIIRTTFEFFFK